jgi:hypothetical protein
MNNFHIGIKRRDLLGLAASTLLSSSAGWAAGRGKSHSKNSKRARLACNSWPFRAYFDTPQMPGYRKAEFPLLTQVEFPQFLADHFDIHNVEFLPQHFVDTDISSIDKVKAGLRKAGSRCCNLMGVEVRGGAFASGTDAQAGVKEAERWVDVAVALGSPSITVALTGKGPFDPYTAASNLKPLVERASQRGVKVLFHNDDLQRESAEILTTVIRQLGINKTGSCPDFGNFATKSAAFALDQLKILVPFASTICHSKEGIADGAKVYNDDFEASMKLMRNSGFKGLYSLEFESLDTPLNGVHKLMERTEEFLL